MDEIKKAQAATTELLHESLGLARKEAMNGRVDLASKYLDLADKCVAFLRVLVRFPNG